MVYYFVTGDKDLHKCPDMDFIICDASECLERLCTFFKHTMGAADIDTLSKKLAEHGPIILGSNSVGAFECRLPVSDDPLLRVEIENGEISVYCTIRDTDGRTLLRILPDRNMNFHRETQRSIC